MKRKILSLFLCMLMTSTIIGSLTIAKEISSTEKNNSNISICSDCYEIQRLWTEPDKFIPESEIDICIDVIGNCENPEGIVYALFFDGERHGKWYTESGGFTGIRTFKIQDFNWPNDLEEHEIGFHINEDVKAINKKAVHPDSIDPDLIIYAETNIKESSLNPNILLFYFKVYIENIGDETAVIPKGAAVYSFDVSIFDRDPYIMHQIYTIELKPGEKYYDTGPYDYISCFKNAKLTCDLVVDPKNIVDESNEDNNEYTYKYGKSKAIQKPTQLNSIFYFKLIKNLLLNRIINDNNFFGKINPLSIIFKI